MSATPSTPSDGAAEARENVFVSSTPLAPILQGVDTVRGYDFNNGIDYEALLASYTRTGFQARNFGLAVEEIMRMLTWRVSDEEAVTLFENNSIAYESPEDAKRKARTKIFLGYTSNMVSCGVREVIRFLCQHKLVDVLVSSAGGVEEDFIKCLAPTYVGDFALKGVMLRDQGVNRIGNLLIANDNYIKFEEWLTPILDQMHVEQQTQGMIWTPSTIINRLGKEINNEDSIYYWCWKNNIPVFCPGLTDGSIGDMMYFHSFSVSPPLICDIARDIRKINDQATHCSPRTGMVILGGGVVKHHICNANLMRNGADFSVYINTGQEFDGSDSGARPDEAISWGKIKREANPVKVYADASLVFPLLVAQSFAKYHFDSKKAEESAAASSSA